MAEAVEHHIINNDDQRETDEDACDVFISLRLIETEKQVCGMPMPISTATSVYMSTARVRDHPMAVCVTTLYPPRSASARCRRACSRQRSNLTGYVSS